MVVVETQKTSKERGENISIRSRGTAGGRAVAGHPVGPVPAPQGTAKRDVCECFPDMNERRHQLDEQEQEDGREREKDEPRIEFELGLEDHHGPARTGARRTGTPARTRENEMRRSVHETRRFTWSERPSYL